MRIENYADTKMNNTVKNIYINIPFCKTKCPWCYIPIRIAKGDKIQLYTKALLSEIEYTERIYDKFPQITFDIQRIFFGGGTANLLSPTKLGEILMLLKQKFPISDQAVITLEVLPDWIEPELFATLKEGGFNRISVAAQSFHDQRLKILKRTHSELDCIKTINAALLGGFTCVNTELMWGYPNCDINEVKEDFQKAFDVGTTELTTQWYNTLSNGTPTDINKAHFFHESYQKAKELSYSRGFYNPSIQVFTRSNHDFIPQGNNGPGIAQSDYGGLISFGWGAKSFINSQMGVISSSLDEYINDASNRTFTSIDKNLLELGFFLYNLTSKKKFSVDSFCSVFDYSEIAQSPEILNWIRELEAYNIIYKESKLYHVTEFGESNLDMYMAWLGLNNRGGNRS